MQTSVGEFGIKIQVAKVVMRGNKRDTVGPSAPRQTAVEDRADKLRAERQQRSQRILGPHCLAHAASNEAHVTWRMAVD